jgi:outer membrane receptor protein involved in Fe transport
MIRTLSAALALLPSLLPLLATAQEGGELGELPAVVVESAPRPRINDRVPAPVRTEAPVAAFDTIEEPGKGQGLLSVAGAASMGRASAEELMARPYLRRGELLEVVPGMIITQHSGGGKANQYFVRGFNLDHGTDFAVFLDAMPVNLRSHGHGQGYADLNFIIPELVESMDYTKGPYFSDLGDFATAGSARFRYYDVLPEGMASASVGENDFFRFLFLDSEKAGGGYLTTAFEYTYYDGPWLLEEDFSRFNGLVKFHWESGVNRHSLTAMGYKGEWISTDQVPRRAILDGRIDRLGFIDPTVGGESERYSLSWDWIHEGDRSTTEVNTYVGRYNLDLYSNFTYFLDDPADGDQFNQYDDRTFAGLRVVNTRDNEILGREGSFTLGLESHHDFIDEVGLYRTSARRRLGTVRADEIYEGSYSAFVNQQLALNDWLRLNGGVRGDLYRFDVTSLSGLPANGGSETAGIVNPKFGAVLGPWSETELFFNWGGGFHSNDARGVTIAIDPDSGLPASPVDPLVRQWGTELGVRTEVIPTVTTSVAVWYLESASELLFVGDAGNTEAGPATQRYGVEWAAYWTPRDWIQVDSELSVAEAEFRDKSQGRFIENSVPVSLSAGITLGAASGPYGALRARYFSERPLVPDRSVESRDSLVFNLRTGYRKERWDVFLEVLNLFDTDANDIEYFYESRLPGEPAAGFEDVHLHPMEPRTVRAGVAVRW